MVWSFLARGPGGGRASDPQANGRRATPRKLHFLMIFISIIVDCLIGVQWIVNGGTIYTLCDLKGLSGLIDEWID